MTESERIARQSTLLRRHMETRNGKRCCLITWSILACLFIVSLDILCMIFATKDLGCPNKVKTLTLSSWLWILGMVGITDFVFYLFTMWEESKLTEVWRFIVSSFVTTWCILGGLLLFENSCFPTENRYLQFALFIWCWVIFRTFLFFGRVCRSIFSL
jgi:hypothetical protein